MECDASVIPADACMIRCLPLFLALSLVPLCSETLATVPPESVGISGDRLTRLNTTMEQYTKEGRIAGAVTYIARYGKIAHFRAYGIGDIENNRPMTTDTLFRIASQTKAVTSVAVMMLWRRARVRLADPVSKFIPAFKQTMVIVPPPLGAPTGSPYGPCRKSERSRSAIC
jgi:CubicO group peptidase (beta-lactamase class C family)